MVSVYALSCGHFTLPEYQFVHPVSKDARKTVPSLAFLLVHTDPNTGRATRILFDLGLRRDINRYVAPIQKHIETRQPLTTEPDVVASLAKGGLTPDDIDYIIYSHVHWDHIGEPLDFPTSTFVVGHGSIDVLNGNCSSLRGGHSTFEKDLLPVGRTIELAGPAHVTTTNKSPPPELGGLPNFSQDWKPLGSLPRTLDLFNDGSVYIVDAPGHLPGHINLLGHTPNGRIYLGGDACHDRRLLTGEKEIGEWHDVHGNVCCIHADRAAAEATIERIRRLEKDGVEIIFSHDVEWENDPANKQNRLKQEFDKELGPSAFDPSWSRLLRFSPPMFAATMRLTSVPKRKSHLAPKIQSLISLAVSASSTHLHVPHIQRHTRAALSHGATKAEIVEVLCLTSTLGIHACNIGVPLLCEVLREEGHDVPSGMDGMSEEQWRLKEEFERKRGYWHGFWEDFLRLSPEFFEAYTEFSGVPWEEDAEAEGEEGGEVRKGVLEPKVKELIYCAFDAAATHLYQPGLKMHMKNVLTYGGTAEEIMEVLELATLLSTSTLDVGLEVLEISVPFLPPLRTLSNTLLVSSPTFSHSTQHRETQRKNPSQAAHDVSSKPASSKAQTPTATD
ncbi:Metallo-hydrolase/oxidoreductase [Westerdykella ornata]|uniref:Metallo-hydrolase/oxidoreductase n=1 Tax=Westerdykella ornata TaxID=318751 RepID=A0A6A6JJ19_WESOR|nr:Metallo-hydrolase/oxidoreductase [Westerdykella ornata]KAF2276591.1 Metallo-hydrolase/oxidoreductase [Westerdykella ornata]